MATEIGLELIEQPTLDLDNSDYVTKSTNAHKIQQLSKNGLIQYIAACSATFVSFLTGVCWGWMGPLHLIFFGENPPFIVTPEELSWTASIAPLASMPSTLIAGLVVDLIGRKFILVLSGILFTIAWLFVYFADNISMINTSRIVSGIAFGSVLNIVPMYIGEISSAEVRGRFSNLIGLQINLGILVGYCIFPYVSFRTSAMVFVVLPILFLLTFSWMPESPYYFLIKNEKQQATSSLRKLRARNYDVKQEINEMLEFVGESKNPMKKATLWSLFKVASNQKALFISFILFSTQQLCGISALLIYAPVMFKELDYALDPKICNIIFGLVSIVTLFIVGFLVDRLGRRTLIIISAATTALGLFIVGIFFYLIHLEIESISNYNLIPTIVLMTFPFTYGIGLNSLPYVYVGELFSTEFKAMASCISIIYASLLCFIIVKIYQPIEVSYGVHANLLIFALCSLIGAIFIYRYVPETKRQTLADIQLKLKVTNR